MSTIEITINNDQDHLEFDSKQIRNTIQFALNAFDVSEGSVSLVVVENDTIRQLKKEYFQIDEVTDVISFGLSQKDESFDCEIVINAQRAMDVAQEKTSDPIAELHLYVIHGLLHQLGYDDATDDGFEKMHQKEDQLLTELGFGNVFSGKGD